MLIGVIVVGAALVFLSVVQSLVGFYVSMLLLSFGAGGCTSVVTMTAVSQWFRKHIGKALAFMTSGFGASGLMLPFIVALTDTFGWRTAVIVLGVVIWVLGIPLALVVRDSPEKYGYAPDGLPPVKMPTANTPFPEKAPKKSYRDILKDRPFLFLNLAEAFRFMALTSVVVHIMPYMSVIGVSRTRAGFIAAAIPILSIIGRFIFGWLGDLFNKRYMTVTAFLMMALGMLALSFIQLPGMLWLFLVLFPCGFGGIAVLRATILREYYDNRVFGSMMGLMMGFAATGGIIGPTVAGWVFDMFRDYHYVWMGFCATLILSIGFVMNFKPHKPVRANASH